MLEEAQAVKPPEDESPNMGILVQSPAKFTQLSIVEVSVYATTADIQLPCIAQLNPALLRTSICTLLAFSHPAILAV